MSSSSDFSANRRLGERRVTDVKILVSSERSGLKKCRLRDISMDGAFIETKNFALAKGAKVDLVLRIRRKEKTQAYPVPAEVIRVGKDGAALMFAPVNRHVYRILLDIVNLD
jgi:hypothetical protein